MNLKERILNSSAYFHMTKAQKDLVRKKHNIDLIYHHLKVIENIGVEKWKQQSNPNYLNKLLIKELCNEKK